MGSIVNVVEFEHSGIKVIQTEYKDDKRGSNTKVFSNEELKEKGIDFNLVEILLIHSNKNTLRGVHYQKNYSQRRMLICTRGSIFVALININKESVDYGKSYTYILKKSNEVLYVSEDYALGTMAIEDADITCMCGENIYKSEYATGIRWNDPDIDIMWPVKDGIITSSADEKLPLFREL